MANFVVNVAGILFYDLTTGGDISRIVYRERLRIVSQPSSSSSDVMRWSRSLVPRCRRDGRKSLPRPGAVTLNTVLDGAQSRRRRRRRRRSTFDSLAGHNNGETL